MRFLGRSPALRNRTHDSILSRLASKIKLPNNRPHQTEWRLVRQPWEKGKSCDIIGALIPNSPTQESWGEKDSARNGTSESKKAGYGPTSSLGALMLSLDASSSLNHGGRLNRLNRLKKGLKSALKTRVAYRRSRNLGEVGSVRAIGVVQIPAGIQVGVRKGVPIEGKGRARRDLQKECRAQRLFMW